MLMNIAQIIPTYLPSPMFSITILTIAPYVISITPCHLPGTTLPSAIVNLYNVIYTPTANAMYTVEFVIDRSNAPISNGTIRTISNCSNGDPILIITCSFIIQYLWFYPFLLTVPLLFPPFCLCLLTAEMSPRFCIPHSFSPCLSRRVSVAAFLVSRVLPRRVVVRVAPAELLCELFLPNAAAGSSGFSPLVPFFEVLSFWILSTDTLLHSQPIFAVISSHPPKHFLLGFGLYMLSALILLSVTTLLCHF